MRLMTRDGMRLVRRGLVFGSLGGVGVNRLLAFGLCRVSPLDTTTWAPSLVAMALAGLVNADPRASRVIR